jgi:Tfp pilus assembly protein PilV
MDQLDKKKKYASLLQMEKVPKGRMRRIKASTLVESLIAMVIIVMCLGVGTMIYTNVLNSDKQVVQLKAISVLNTLANQTKTEKNFLDSEQQLNDWKIKKTVNKYEQTQNLYQLSFSVFDTEGHLITSRNELITIN